MPGFDYARMQATASQLLERFSQGVVAIIKPRASTPGANSWDPLITDDPVVYTLDATVKGVSKQFANGTTVLATDLEVTEAVFGADVEPPDQLAIDGQTVVVVETMRVPAAGTLVASKFIVRA
jgi:hypothetical protein